MKIAITFLLLLTLLTSIASAACSEKNLNCNDYFSYYHTTYRTYYSIDFTGGDNPPIWCTETPKIYQPKYGYYQYNPLYPSWQGRARNPNWRSSSLTKYYPMQTWSYEYYSPLY